MLASVMLAVLFSCGGDQQLGFSEPGGGIDGTGYTAGSGNGDITGFGSVLFGDSEFETSTETEITIDSVPVDESELEIGMVADYLVGEDASADLLTGTAQLIAVNSLLKGPVTSLDPLQVLGVPVLLEDGAQCEAVGCLPSPALTVGDLVTVYGFMGGDNIARATRLELKSAIAGNLPQEWKLQGRVDAAGIDSLVLGSQLVSTMGVTPDDCDSGISAGVYVTIIADPNPLAGFGTLNLVRDVYCGQPGIPLPQAGVDTKIYSRAEGIVTGYAVGIPEFMVGGQLVTLDLVSPGLQFENGTVDDLIDGVRVEVEGYFDTATRILEIIKVDFDSGRLEIVAPVDPQNIDAGNNSFNVMGITVFVDLSTSDEVGVFTGGLTTLRQLAIKAELKAGNVVADEIRDEGAPNYGEVKLQGPLQSPQPDIAFDVLGVGVDLLAGTQFFGANDQPLAGGVTEFFNLVAVGDLVEVKGELSVGSPGTISAGEVELQGN